MISREDLLNAVLAELAICKHLYTKLPEGSYDYRPSESQRTTTELLQYLSVGALGALHMCIEGSWDTFRKLDEESEAMAPENFLAAMDSQAERYTALFNSIPDSDLTEKMVKSPSGEIFPMATAIMRIPFSHLVAYKMQLFLYAKACGATDINTSNAWAGRDWKPKPAVAAEAVAEA